MYSKHPVIEKIDSYYDNNYPETILLDTLALAKQVKTMRLNYRSIIYKLEQPDNHIVFSTYLSRKQLRTLVDKGNDFPLFKECLHKKLEASIDTCGIDDLACRINTFQLIGTSGIARNHASLFNFEPTVKRMHETIQLSYLNVSLFSSTRPFEQVHDVFQRLENNQKLISFFYSFLNFYYDDVSLFFSRLKRALQEKNKNEIAGTLPALYTIFCSQKKYPSFENLKDEYAPLVKGVFNNIPSELERKIVAQIGAF